MAAEARRKNPPVARWRGGGSNRIKGRRQEIRNTLEAEPMEWLHTEQIANSLLDSGYPETVGNKRLESAVRADLDQMFQDAVWHLEPHPEEHKWRFNPDFTYVDDPADDQDEEPEPTPRPAARRRGRVTAE